MKRINIIFIAVTAILITACNTRSEQALNDSQSKNELIFEKGDKIDSPNFTGKAWLNNLILADSLNQNAVGSVTFEPGARTSWHSHPAGQIILALVNTVFVSPRYVPNAINIILIAIIEMPFLLSLIKLLIGFYHF